MSNKRRHPTVSKLDYIKLHNSSQKDAESQASTAHEKKGKHPAKAAESAKHTEHESPKKKSHAAVTKKSPNSSRALATESRGLVVKEFVPHNEPEKKTRKRKGLPPFLKSFGGGSKEKAENKDIFDQPKDDNHTDSLGNLFAQDQEKVEGVQRVFRKSLTFLILSMISFGMLVFASINLFAIPWYITLISAIGFVAFTCIFFVILADRSYMWLSLFGIVSIFLVAHLVLGQLLSPITIIGAAAFSIFYYLSYVDLERMQMGARLFNIRNITQQTVQALIWCSIMVISLGVFNSVIYEGTEEYFQRAFLTNEFIVDNVVIGRNSRINLNRLLDVSVPDRAGDLINPPTLSSFLELNYNRGDEVVSDNEAREINFECRQLGGEDCDQAAAREKANILKRWKKDEFADLKLDLESPLTPVNYYDTLSSYYSFRIRSFEQSVGSVFFLDASYILPSAVTLFVLALLCIGWIIWSWLINICIFIIWRILRLFGFAKIDIENVEAEIVSI